MTRSSGATIIGSLLLILAAIAVVLFVVRLRQSDVEFCRRALRDLTQGRWAAREVMDWPHLRALDVNVGTTYATLPNQDERRKYQAAFVDNFSRAFRQAQGRLDAFTNWRILERRGATTLVAADYLAAQKTLIFTVADLGWGRRRIGAIQWQ